MSRIAYVDGTFQPHGSAGLHIEDRATQFADAVYEVWGVADGGLLDAGGHFSRLKRSLAELRIPMPVERSALEAVLFEMIRRNRLRNGLIYLQISRGRARRDHAFPPPNTPPTLVITAKRLDPEAADRRAESGIAVVTMPDLRWARCDIKSVSLLPNILAKQAAKEAGAAEAWMVDSDGFITEGSSTNAWIITRDGKLVTRPANHAILNGITRRTLFSVAEACGVEIEERAFTVAESLAAREAFVTSASSYVLPVVSIDENPIGNGHPGEISSRLRTAYKDAARATAQLAPRRQNPTSIAHRAKRRISRH